MTTAYDQFETDEEREARETAEADEQRGKNTEGFLRRKLSERDREIADLKTTNAAYERRDALDKAKRDIEAEGPLGAFLRTYGGEPTADAIRTAVAADPDFAGLITFTPDPRDVNAQTQADNARKMAGGEAVPTEFTPEDFANLDMNEQVRFMESQPDAMRALEAGQPVTRPAGW